MKSKYEILLGYRIYCRLVGTRLTICNKMPTCILFRFSLSLFRFWQSIRILVQWCSHPGATIARLLKSAQFIHVVCVCKDSWKFHSFDYYKSSWQNLLLDSAYKNWNIFQLKSPYTRILNSTVGGILVSLGNLMENFVPHISAIIFLSAYFDFLFCHYKMCSVLLIAV